MKDRLLLFMNRENISATTLADEIGVQRSSISHILSGRNNPSYDFIYKLIRKYESINTEWLLTGKGDMYKKEQQIEAQRTEESIHLENEKIDIKGISEENNYYDYEGKPRVSESGEKSEIPKVTNVNKIEKIVYFYKNGTFKEYNPSE